MMNCQTCQERLVAYVDGLLDEPLRREVDGHLEGCPSCRAELEAVACLHRRLVAGGEALARASLDGAVMDTIRREHATGPKETARRRTYVGRGLAAAVAATVILSGILALVFLSGGASLTMADVQAEMAKKSWVHVKYDNGRERWVSLPDGKVYYKSEAQTLTYVSLWNEAEGYYLMHWMGSEYIQKNPYPRKGGARKRKPRTPWEYFVGPWERLSEEHGKPGQAGGTTPAQLGLGRFIGKVERKEDAIDGKAMMRFDVYRKRQTDKQELMMQLWADPATRLPVRIRWRLPPSAQKQQKREWIAGMYDFPEKGPASIHDLGAPRGLEVLDMARKPDPRVIEVRDAMQKARKRFPEKCRVIRWDDVQGSLTILYRNGVKTRNGYYVMGYLPEEREWGLPLPTTPEKILKWAENFFPKRLDLSDGEKLYQKLDHTYGSKEPFKVRVSAPREPEGWFHDLHWPLFSAGPMAKMFGGGPMAKIMENMPDTPPGCIVIRRDAPVLATREVSKFRMDYTIDPSRDYICVRNVYWRKVKGRWHIGSEARLSNFRRLPGGHWYAGTLLRIRSWEPEEKIYKRPHNIDVKVLRDDEFPPDAFDGKKLLERSKVVDY